MLIKYPVFLAWLAADGIMNGDAYPKETPR